MTDPKDVKASIDALNALIESTRDRSAEMAAVFAGLGQSLTHALPPALLESLAPMTRGLTALIPPEHIDKLARASSLLTDDVFRAGAFQNIAPQMQAVIAALNHTDLEAVKVQPLIDAWEKSDRIVHDNAEFLAHFGWTIPMEMETPRLIELLTLTHQTSINDAFVDFYTTKDGVHLHALRNRLLQSPAVRDWRPLIEQCFDSYSRAHYLICVPALLSIVEGAIAKPARARSTFNRKVRKLYFDEKLSAAAPRSVDAATWRSIAAFFDCFFADSDFGQSSPPVRLNRHWTAHGRDLFDSKEPEVLQLFQAIDTITYVVC